MIDLTGKTFGMLVVIKRAAKPEGSKRPDAYWVCLCECGKRKTIRSEVLRDGRNKSCGCNHRLHWIDKDMARRSAA